MGEVYRARDIRLERTIAIKILPVDVSSDPARRQRFQREAKIISSLNHRHICLHDVGTQDGLDFLVMEYIDGETLADRLRRGAIPVEQVLKFAIQITDALDKAHMSGVVHCDLKPGNIMLTSTGRSFADQKLKKVSLNGEALVTLADVPPKPHGATWNSEGIIAFSSMQIGRRPIPIRSAWLETNLADPSRQFAQ
jgi:serine/threonine protein kinase